MTFNPYAPPMPAQPAIVAPGGDGYGVWRELDLVVVHRQGAMLPDRCIHCNAPAAGFRKQKTFYWHHPAIYLVALISPLIYVIAALIVRKTASVALPLCEQHRIRRRNGMLIGWLGFLFGFVLLFVAPALDVPLLLAPAFLFMLAAPITGAVMARLASVKRMDDHHAWLKCGQPFVESIPAYGAFAQPGYAPAPMMMPPQRY